MIMAATVATMSFAGSITLDFILLPGRLNWLLFVLCCYILRFGNSLPLKKDLTNNHLIILFLILILWEGVQALIMGRNIGFNYLIQFFTYIVFYAYFLKLIRLCNSLNILIEPYCLYYCVSVVVIIASAILIGAGFISPTDNPITENRLMNNNINNYGTYYYWPAHLSVVSLSTRIELFENVPIPLLCGFSHEPHVLAHSIYPAFFLIYFYIRKKSELLKLTLIFSLIILQLLAFSTTALICMGLVLLLDFFIYSSKPQTIKIIILIVSCLLLYIISLKFNLFNQILNESISKVSGEDHSKSYSTGLLIYGLYPKGIIGDGIYLEPSTIKNFLSGNIGLISSILINLIYTIFAFKSFLNFKSRNSLCHFIGLATLYFTFHSLKLGCLIFNYPMMFYMIFLVSYSDKIRTKRINNLN